METIFYFAGFAAFVGAAAYWIKSDNKKNNRPSFKRGQVIICTSDLPNVEPHMAMVNGVDTDRRVLHTTHGGMHFSKAAPLAIGREVTVIKSKKRVKVTGFNGSIVETTGGNHHYLLLKP